MSTEDSGRVAVATVAAGALPGPAAGTPSEPVAVPTIAPMAAPAPGARQGAEGDGPAHALADGAHVLPESVQDLPGSAGEHRLQERLGTAARARRFYGEQVLDHVNARMREFIGRQEMFFLATADAGGSCDSTFRAGPPGFLQVLDERTLAYPDYRGNGVLASMGNIEENPHVGILLVDFFQDRVGLHVNGRAHVVDDVVMRAQYPWLPVDPVPGRRALVWVEIEVEEAYIHCAKHIPHLRKVPRRPREEGRAWGTDDVRRKGGDFFGAAAEKARREAASRACG
ncbi:pyridoxamine 5'-phosphate oxidase family protein [Streptomyces gamaensis]|uniref:Pyridoxamine 5'-phosphate oxidase family protein n=1 Tax=Streptomyces gamaensis TaxID=1763542 RepID=A0ABW0YY95_9ACTN